MDDIARPRNRFKRALNALAALNLNALRALARAGPSGAEQYLTYTHRMYTGYGLPWMWSGLPWRKDLSVPQVPVQQLFPEIDFTHSPQLIHPFPRGLSTQPHELMILAHVVNFLKPERVIEFGTAEGRTTLNLALHLPPTGEVVTLDFPPIPGKNEVGFFYWDQPLRSKIKQIFQGVGSWESTPYHASAAVVFCDACDLPDGLEAETAQAFKVVKPGGVIFRHDYSSAQGPTLYWNALAKELPVKHLEGTTLVCLRVDTRALYDQLQKMAASGRVIPS